MAVPKSLAGDVKRSRRLTENSSDRRYLIRFLGHRATVPSKHVYGHARRSLRLVGNRSLQNQGPAEIGEVTFSKIGATAYYKWKSFRQENCAYGNHVCNDDGNVYWISGVKKRGSNRSKYGSGPVLDTTKGGKPSS